MGQYKGHIGPYKVFLTVIKLGETLVTSRLETILPPRLKVSKIHKEAQLYKIQHWHIDINKL